MPRARKRGNSKKRATVTVEYDLVCVQIKGYKREGPVDDSHGLGPLPTLPDDSDLVSDLHSWMCAEEIYSFAMPLIGGGMMNAYFKSDDAERVLKWLEEHNVVT